MPKEKCVGAKFEKRGYMYMGGQHVGRSLGRAGGGQVRQGLHRRIPESTKGIFA